MIWDGKRVELTGSQNTRIMILRNTTINIIQLWDISAQVIADLSNSYYGADPSANNASNQILGVANMIGNADITSNC